MLFGRVPQLGVGGILLLHLSACAVRSAGDGPVEQAQTSNRESQGAVNAATDAVEGSANADEACPITNGYFDLEALKWKNTLTKPPVFDPELSNGVEHYRVTVREEPVQMLPSPCSKTKVIAYGGKTKGGPAAGEFGSPGPTFEMKRGTPARVEWSTLIEKTDILLDAPTHHGVNDQSTFAYVTHVHGLEVAPSSDGWPEDYVTKAGGVKVYEYPNSQPATTLWYHDHALGRTSRNVYSGLAGLYVIRDEASPIESALPRGEYDMPLVIQDRSFNVDGSLSYTVFGETTIVNGKVWPEMRVDPTRYRFRVLNGATFRSYDLSLVSISENPASEGPAPAQAPKITLIGSDGGFLGAATELSSLALAPGERGDVLIDFSELAGTSFILRDSDGTDVVRFNVSNASVNAPGPLPTLEPLPALPEATEKRTLTLHETDNGEYYLDGQPWHGEISEESRVGSTEDWDIVNLTSSPHPIHLHLVQFRVVGRQALKTSDYLNDWLAQNGENLGKEGTLPLTAPTKKLPLAAKYLLDDRKPPEAPAPAEAGWKDTVVAPGDMVTTIRVRWAPQDASDVSVGTNPFEFDPTGGPGYVWHCHMLNHEDNDMMRPFKLLP